MPGKVPARMPDGLRPAIRVLFAVTLVLVFVLSVLKVSVGPQFRFGDKVGHALGVRCGPAARIGAGGHAQAGL